MPLFPSDFKKFKHVKSDDKTTTLRHPAGHEITIMHSALKGDMRKQMQALAEGGDVESTLHKAGDSIKKAVGAGKVEQDYGSKTQGAAVSTKESGKDVRTPEQKAKAAEYERTGGLPGYAQGGNVECYADGGEVAPKPEDVVSQPPVDPELLRKRELYNQMLATTKPETEFPAPDAERAFGPQGEEPKHFSPITWTNAEQSYQNEKADNAANAAAEQQKAIQLNSQRVAAGLQPIAVPNVPEGPQPPGSAEVAAQGIGQPLPQAGNQAAVPTTANTLAGTQQDMEGMLKSGYNAELQGINQQAAAQGAMGEAQNLALQQNLQSQTEAKAQYQKHYDELNAERQNLMHDVQEGYVDPEKYWSGDKNGNGGHSRIASAIGMIIAGFNPTNSPNAAINYLKFQMDQNLQSQKENLSSKQNLLSANLKQFGNMKDATEMTRLMQSDMMENQLKQAAAKATSPLAKAAALQAAGKLQMDSAPIFQQFAMKRALMNMAQNGGSPQSIDHLLGYMRVTNPEMAKEMEGRYVPGVGLASIPVTPEVRTKMVAHNNFGQALQDMNKFVKSHTTLVPGTPDYITGQAKAMALQTMIRENLLNTVYREGEQPLLDKMLQTNPAGIMKYATGVQLKQLEQMNNRDFNNLKTSVGLQQSTPTSTESEIQTGKDGKQYKRIGNFMVPVQPTKGK